MGWNVRTDITQEEFDRYVAVVIDYVKERKGWNPREYRIRFITALADAPLVAVNVIHYDGVKDLKANPPRGFGVHPLEMQVYVHTEKMRAFEGVEEYHQIRNQARERNAGK